MGNRDTRSPHGRVAMSGTLSHDKGLRGQTLWETSQRTPEQRRKWMSPSWSTWLVQSIDYNLTTLSCARKDGICPTLLEDVLFWYTLCSRYILLQGTHLAVPLKLGKFRLLAAIPLHDSGHCEPEDIEDVDLPHLQPCSHFPLKVTISEEYAEVS